jgi:hypothetical protein
LVVVVVVEVVLVVVLAVIVVVVVVVVVVVAVVVVVVVPLSAAFFLVTPWPPLSLPSALSSLSGSDFLTRCAGVEVTTTRRARALPCFWGLLLRLLL